MFFRKCWGVFLFLFLMSGVHLAFAAGSGPITIDKVSESFDPKTNEYTYTVVVKNTGKLAVDYFLTAQPYNDKTQDKSGKAKDAAARQTQKVNIGAEQKSTFKFVFKGADGKNWKFKYTDLYDGDPAKKGTKLVTADIGEFSLRPVEPDHTFDQFYSVQFPYPYAAKLLDLGETNFYVDITDQNLPADWKLASFDPAPGDLFLLAPGEVKTVDIALRSDLPVVEGQVGSVQFDFVNPDSGAVKWGWRLCLSRSLWRCLEVDFCWWRGSIKFYDDINGEIALGGLRRFNGPGPPGVFL